MRSNTHLLAERWNWQEAMMVIESPNKIIIVIIIYLSSHFRDQVISHSPASLKAQYENLAVSWGNGPGTQSSHAWPAIKNTNTQPYQLPTAALPIMLRSLPRLWIRLVSPVFNYLSQYGCIEPRHMSQIIKCIYKSRVVMVVSKGWWKLHQWFTVQEVNKVVIYEGNNTQIRFQCVSGQWLLCASLTRSRADVRHITAPWKHTELKRCNKIKAHSTIMPECEHCV